MVKVRNALFSKYVGLLPAPNLKMSLEAKNVKELMNKIPQDKQWIVQNSFQKSGGLSPLDPILLNGVPLQAFDGTITKLKDNDKVLFVNKVRGMPEIWSFWTTILDVFGTIVIIFKIITFSLDKNKRNKFLNMFLNKTLSIRKIISMSSKTCKCCNKNSLMLIAYESNGTIYLCKNCRMYSKKSKKEFEVIRFPKVIFANYNDIYTNKK